MDQREYTPHQVRLDGPGQGGGWFARMLRLAVLLILLVVGFMFSLVAFAVLAVGGALVWGYFWWKTRKLRQQFREQQGFASSIDPYADGGQVIEGEVIRQEEPGSEDRK